jgi:hypothetical protein
MPLPYGYVSFNGHKWANIHVDAYNAYCERCEIVEREKGLLPDYMANGRHHLFCMFSGMLPL